MMTRFRGAGRFARPVKGEEGATLVFFGLMVVALFACFSIAVDLGLWLNTGSEAQRTADSAALAGAAEYWHLSHLSPAQVKPLAEAKAREFAGENYVGRTMVDPDDAYQVEVVDFPAEQRRVGVWIRGQTAPLFARMLGIEGMAVARYAEARVVPSGGATCVKPFALPDLWKRGGGQTQLYNPNDDPASWVFNPANGDTYQPWDGSNVNDPDATGFGSKLRDGLTNGWSTTPYTRDNGRRVLIKAASTQGGGNNAEVEVQVNINPGIYLPIVLPGSTPNANCGLGNDGGVNGAAAFSRNICACNNSTVNVGDSLSVKNGNMVGATNQGVADLIAMEPRTLQWRPNNGGGGEVYDVNSGLAVTESPRMIKVVLYDPAQVLQGQQEKVRVQNLATVFVEGTQGNGPQQHVIGRFMYYGQGSGEGTDNGTLLRTLQLVK